MTTALLPEFFHLPRRFQFVSITRLELLPLRRPVPTKAQLPDATWAG
jgi:type VI protein secretion system component VasA